MFISNAILALLISASHPPLSATVARASAVGSEPVSVIIVLKETFGSRNLDALVRRYPDGGRNIIAIRRQALTPEFLAKAVRMMASSVSLHGQPSRTYVNTALFLEEKAAPITDTERTRLNAIIDRLAKSPVRSVEHVGQVRAITITVGD